MKTIRDCGFIKVLLWLVIFVSHINIALANVAATRRITPNPKYVNESDHISASDVNILSEKAKSKKDNSVWLLSCFIMLGSFLLRRGIALFSKNLLFIYERFVKVFQLNQAYLFNKVLLI